MDVILLVMFVERLVISTIMFTHYGTCSAWKENEGRLLRNAALCLSRRRIIFLGCANVRAAMQPLAAGGVSPCEMLCYLAFLFYLRKAKKSED